MTGSTVITQHLDRFSVQPASTTATMQSVGALRHDTSDFAAHSPASKPATCDRNFTLRYVNSDSAAHSSATKVTTTIAYDFRLPTLAAAAEGKSLASNRNQTREFCRKLQQLVPAPGSLPSVHYSALLYGGCCCPKAPTQKVEVQHLATFKSRTLRDDLSS